MNEDLHRLNELADEEAAAELLKCCASREWARRMSTERPFLDAGELFASADRVWWSLDEEDWLEAFRGHPQIGGGKAASEVSPESSRWSESEQEGARDAERPTLAALADANRRYEEKFGFIYIVCATGKSGAEMLDILNTRLSNERDTELRIAAEEQRRITALRLSKLLNL